MVARRRTESGQFDFGRAVLGFTNKVYKTREEIFKRSFLRLADEMQASCPRDTHFLLSSLEAATNKTPAMTRKNPNPNAPPGTFSWDRSQVVGVVESAQAGQKLYLGYTAEYAGVVHDGHGNVEPKPWVTLVTQRWKSIVDDVAREVRDLGV